MDYANRQWVKIYAAIGENPKLIARPEDPAYPVKTERAMVLYVEASDWSCPQHITQRYTIEEIRERTRRCSTTSRSSRPGSRVGGDDPSSGPCAFDGMRPRRRRKCEAGGRTPISTLHRRPFTTPGSSPHWTVYDALRFGLRAHPKSTVTLQKRACTSPIRYTPGR